MMGNMQQMIKQAQNMQKQMLKVQEEIAQLKFEGSAGGGLVTVVVTGQQTIEKVTISEKAMDDRELLEDMVLTAINDGMTKSAEESKKRLAAVTGGLKVPGLF
jgi:DNA-binding YbaB/EbfC family protein